MQKNEENYSTLQMATAIFTQLSEFNKRYSMNLLEISSVDINL